MIHQRFERGHQQRNTNSIHILFCGMFFVSYIYDFLTINLTNDYMREYDANELKVFHNLDVKYAGETKKTTFSDKEKLVIAIKFFSNQSTASEVPFDRNELYK